MVRALSGDRILSLISPGGISWSADGKYLSVYSRWLVEMGGNEMDPVIIDTATGGMRRLDFCNATLTEKDVKYSAGMFDPMRPVLYYAITRESDRVIEHVPPQNRKALPFLIRCGARSGQVFCFTKNRPRAPGRISGWRGAYEKHITKWLFQITLF